MLFRGTVNRAQSFQSTKKEDVFGDGLNCQSSRQLRHTRDIGLKIKRNGHIVYTTSFNSMNSTNPSTSIALMQDQFDSEI